MPRRKKFRLKVKKNTLYTTLAFLLVCVAVLITISFFQQGTLLTQLNASLTETIGWGIYVSPLVLLLISLVLLRLKLTITRINVLSGVLLSLLSSLSITQAGVVGSQIWSNFENFASPLGALFLLSLMFGIGLLVLFNITLDDIFESLKNAVSAISSQWKSLTAKKPNFVQKLNVKTPSDLKREALMTVAASDGKKENLVINKSKLEKSSTGTHTAIAGLGSGLVTNIPASATPYEYPPLSLLSPSQGQKADRGDMKSNAHVIEKTLESFGIIAKVVEVNGGPAVTQYALEIGYGVKLSKITSLSNDLALALAAPTGQVRIEAPIPGKSLVGIEIPNRSLEFVTLRAMLGSDVMKRSKDKLQVAMGLNVSGEPVVANISRMPHVLVAGTTGSGKSVLVNSWIASLLFRTNPNEVKLIMIDPKRVELSLYNGIPHLLCPVIVDKNQTLSALRWALDEMERRYKTFEKVGVRSLDSYNELAGFQALPYIVIFIDELAELMTYAPAEVEDSVCRLAQMARATGVHLVLATQRPSVDVITGLLKANIPSRVAFNVSSMIDSRVIIDTPGAEKLLGRGDMLYIPPDQAKPTRIQGAFISEREVNQLVTFLKSKNPNVQYSQEVTTKEVNIKVSGNSASSGNSGLDPLFETAVQTVCQYNTASASFLQRKMSIGFSRAGRIMDQLEEEGIVSAPDGAKGRNVLVKSYEEFLAKKQQKSAS